MTLTFGLRTARDLLAKLYREHERLNEEVSSDGMFNFVVTGYHITDWIKNDPAAPREAKADLGSMYNNERIAVCRDLANASKHFELDYKDSVTAETSSMSGYGVGRYGAGGYGDGEEEIIIVLTDGRRFDALSFAQEVVDAWNRFFNKHGI